MLVDGNSDLDINFDTSIAPRSVHILLQLWLGGRLTKGWDHRIKDLANKLAKANNKGVLRI